MRMPDLMKWIGHQLRTRTASTTIGSSTPQWKWDLHQRNMRLKHWIKPLQYTNPFGMFITGIDRDESAGTDTDGFAKRKRPLPMLGQ